MSSKVSAFWRDHMACSQFAYAVHPLVSRVNAYDKAEATKLFRRQIGVMGMLTRRYPKACCQGLMYNTSRHRYKTVWLIYSASKQLSKEVECFAAFTENATAKPSCNDHILLGPPIQPDDWLPIPACAIRRYTHYWVSPAVSRLRKQKDGWLRYMSQGPVCRKGTIVNNMLFSREQKILEGNQ
jgi:hypothetical protein